MKIAYLICDEFNKTKEDNEGIYRIESSKHGDYNIFQGNDILYSYGGAHTVGLEDYCLEENYSIHHVIEDDSIMSNKNYQILVNNMKGIIIFYHGLIRNKFYKNENISFCHSMPLLKKDSIQLKYDGQYNDIMFQQDNDHLMIMIVPEINKETIHYSYSNGEVDRITIIINSLENLYHLLLNEIRRTLEVKLHKPYFLLSTQEILKYIDSKTME